MIEENKSLKPYNTFGVDANARYFTVINSVSALQALLSDANLQTLPKANSS